MANEATATAADAATAAAVARMVNAAVATAADDAAAAAAARLDVMTAVAAAEAPVLEVPASEALDRRAEAEVLTINAKMVTDSTDVAEVGHRPVAHLNA
jgi:hypothetical protein